MQKQNYWSLFNRPDTLFGVCEGVGQDLGVSPNLLRVAFAVAMIWNPVAVLAAYALLGIAAAVSRWIAPRPAGALVAAAAPESDNDAGQVEFAEAA